MKKLITLMLTFVLAVTACISLAACGNTNKPVVVDGLVLAEEQYGIAAKKGNDALVSKINEALISIADDEMQTIANKYGLTSEIAVKNDTVNPLAAASDDSWTNLVSRNKVVIGYTVFAPIAYEVVEDVPTKGYDIELYRKYMEQEQRIAQIEKERDAEIQSKSLFIPPDFSSKCAVPLNTMCKLFACEALRPP